jgi:hypothetical protein
MQALMDSGATGGSFVNAVDAKRICEIENISPIKLIKPKNIEGFNGAAAPIVTHAIYPRLQIRDHVESLCPLFITTLGKHSIILGKAWMKQHGVMLDMVNDQVIFTKGHCQHTTPTNTQETACPQVDSKIQELVSEPLRTNPCSIAMIGAAPFNMLRKQKGAEVFAVSFKDILEEQAKEEAIEIDPKSILPQEFYDYLDVFSRQAADKLPPHRYADHHIVVEGDSKLGHAPLYNMSREELDLVKKYIEDNLSKGFIEASKAPFASPVLFVRKPGGGLRFCVDYRKLNAITRKDSYPLPLIDETLAQITGAKYLTKIDIRHAFNRIRMQTEEDEDLTTFKTRFGSYKYKVLPFGLTNGPATFQRYMNETLMEYINKFVTAYMDDLLIYSTSRNEHTQHVQMVLQKLREAGLQADIAKCEFYVQETKFLGLIIGIYGMRMDPAKVQTILEWKAPRSLRDTQAFIGFCVFYRRFIRSYSTIMKPLVNLTKKGQIFEWNQACQAAFELIKKTVTEAPVLQHFDRDKTAYVEADASDYISSGVLSQKDDQGVLHPIAFFSKKMTPAECNYEIYDKELLAIIRCFEAWRPEVEGTAMPVQVLSDHKSLEYFMSTKKLTRRQARWAEFLSRYNFQIIYRPGKQNGKADALTRRPGDRPEGNEEDDRQKQQLQTLLPLERLHPDLAQQLELKSQGQAQDAQLAPILPQDQSIHDQIQAAQLQDELCKDTIQRLQNNERDSPSIALAHCEERNGLLLYQNRVWIPEDIQVKLLQEVHDQPAMGHPGIGKMVRIIKRQYYWPRMDKTITQYVKNCHICKRSKATRDAYNGLLQPIPLGSQPWKDISLDFITGLPLCEGNNSILVVACRLTKERHFIPCFAGQEGTTAEATAKLLLQHVWKHHGLPNSIISDRGPQFVAAVWKILCKVWKVTIKLSTAFHPETDGQTERFNAELERYLRAHVNYLQDNWVEYLCMAEFAANALPSDSTKISPFFANKGFEPRMSFDITASEFQIASQEHKDIVQSMKDIWEFLQDQIALSQTRMEHFANQNRKPAPRYKIGDQVWLSTRNIRTQRPSKKLDHKQVGPYKILERIGQVAYRLELPPSMKIHPVFHSNLLRLNSNDALQGQHQEPPPPIIIADELEWEVEEILDSKLLRKKLFYMAAWKNHPLDNTWYPAANFNNAPELTQAFHRKYPQKPR